MIRYESNLIDAINNVCDGLVPMKQKKLKQELNALIQAANEAYLANYAAMLNAPKTPEFEHLRLLNDNLRKAIVRAKQA